MKENFYLSHNGKIVTNNEIVISVFDRLYLYGDGIIEVLAGNNGQPLRVDTHVDRLYRSAELINLSLPWSMAKIIAEITEVAACIPHGRSYLRMSVSSGKGAGLPRTTTEPQRTIICQAIPETTAKPLRLQTRVRANSSFLLAAKTNNYLATIVTQQQAQDDGYDDVLWINAKQQVTEASTANIFFVAEQRGQLCCYTPATDCGLLKGITASWVCKTLNEHKIQVQEQIILLEQCPNFDGAFLTSTIKGIQKVIAIDNTSYPQKNNQTIEGVVKLLQSKLKSDHQNL